MSDAKRASLDEMNELHAMLARTIKGALQHQYMDDDGNPTPPPASTLNVAVQFLRANGITGAAVTPKAVTDFLDEASLPFFNDAVKEVAEGLRKPSVTH